MPNQKNIEQVQEIKEKFAAAEVVILTDYHGLNVAEINELRRLFRDSDIEYKVYKNTLMNIVADELGIKGLDQYLEGPTAVAMSQDVAAPVKVINDFIKSNDNLQIKAGMLGTQVIEAERVNELLKIPSKEQLIAQVIGQLQSPITSLIATLEQTSPIVPLLNTLQQISPIESLTNVLQNTINNIIYVLQAIAAQKEQITEA